MNGHWTKEPIDGIGAPANFWAGRRRQETKIQLAQEWEAPLIVSEAGARLRVWKMLRSGVELSPVLA